MQTNIIKVNNPPPAIKSLLQERDVLRSENNYEEADHIRKRIESEGFILVDEEGRTELYQTSLPLKKTSYLALFGSGGTTAPERKVHEYIFKNLDSPKVRVCLITTPAGFEPNVKIVYEEIAQFIRKSLKNFHPEINIVFANTKEDANNPEIVNRIEGHDYIFTGPGSPTYALRILKDSLLYAKIKDEVIYKKISLGLASAAALAFSHFTLPVYEICKIGDPLHWKAGLNFFQDCYKPITVIPHFNNDNGGKKYDTSYNYMGKDRFEKLVKLLPDNEEIWGIDESTGVVIDLQSKKHVVFGTGNLHVIKNPAF